ncbi:MAG: hypothetical protein AAGC70_16035 [Pseudomonadota bacterium]
MAAEDAPLSAAKTADRQTSSDAGFWIGLLVVIACPAGFWVVVALAAAAISDADVPAILLALGIATATTAILVPIWAGLRAGARHMTASTTSDADRGASR